ncbi:MAG TPA: hypothetical protein VN802_16190 [Stellaceae bacterium]|nr:hypothetical protein [Stellaceae bacterium]
MIKSRADAFCAKLNDGLAAVALVLAMVVLMVGTYRTVEMLELTDQGNLAGWDQPGPQQVNN